METTISLPRLFGSTEQHRTGVMHELEVMKNTISMAKGHREVRTRNLQKILSLRV